MKTKESARRSIWPCKNTHYFIFMLLTSIMYNRKQLRYTHLVI